MDILDYKDIIKKTAVYPEKVDNFGLAYSWLGLLGEAEESRTVYEEFINEQNPTEELKNNLIKEIGDVCWYATNISVILDLDLNKVFNLGGNFYEKLNSTKSIVAYSENIKKYYRDNKPINKEEAQSVLNLLISGMFLSLERFDFVSLDIVLEKNYNKLIKRRETNTLNGDGDNREENG